jgi:5-oxoprolinase (ATP-hydrolysing)
LENENADRCGESLKVMWKFWIDVGGTFTDCLAQSPDGQMHQTKVLSSGVFKGQLHLSDLTDVARANNSKEPTGMWNGAELKLLNVEGDSIFTANVLSSNAGLFKLDRSIPAEISKANSTIAYELNPRLHAPLVAMRVIAGVPISDPLPACTVHLGTTRGTNALLTRSGARTALITSKGLSDFLTIGDQARPHLFQLAIQKPEPLFEQSIEIEERVLADGTVECRPDEAKVRQQLVELKDAGIESIAICLMHGYRYSQHEQNVGKIADEIGFDDVRVSHEVSPLIKLIPRGETTVLDAYLNPVIGNYLDEIQAGLSKESRLKLMTSAGGLVSREHFSGKDSVLSGPAGGVVGAARVATKFGFDRVIGFDMGGTSTDVSRYESVDGLDQFEREYESLKAGIRIVTPMMAIETVAAGGGSVCWFDGTKLCVGPESAGADPGPACYGKGGPLAITDANLFLGRIVPDQFPFRLDRQAVENHLSRMCKKLAAAGFHYSPLELAEGFVKIANHSMATAITTVSIARGYDPNDHVLMSFGGAGAQHCCGVANNLGMSQILDHPQSSILSAVGIHMADRTSHQIRAVQEMCDEQLERRLDNVFAQMESQATDRLVYGDGNSDQPIVLRRRLDMRYAGTNQFLTIERSSGETWETLFHQQHRQLFGYVQDRSVEVVAMRVEAILEGDRLTPWVPVSEFELLKPTDFQDMHFDGRTYSAGRFQRGQIKAGNCIDGPAIVFDRYSTTIVDPCWIAKAVGDGAFLIEQVTSVNQSVIRVTDSALNAPDPVQLEIFNRSFATIARQMGISLQKTSISVNVKERLDFSCAIFTSQGDLVVNAPHIPVHLGAMSETVREVIRRNPRVVAGDVFVTNDPYAGGSHLPDVTVVSPVFDSGQSLLLFWVASRSHHAEIGGKAPGSMPADARFLAEEGVLIDNYKLVDAGTERFGQLEEILGTSPYPSRNVSENLADLAAQVAANRSGAKDLLGLVKQHSFETVQRYMHFMRTAAETKARAAIGKLPDHEMRFSDQLDNGARIVVSIKKMEDGLDIDFAGTDAVTPDNLNANRAIVCSAVMYVIRCLVDEDIPLNEGLLSPVTIRLPECLLNPKAGGNHPHDSPAIVGGNVETSQRVVDVILGALEVAAASQGTMNNWLIGDDSFGYYETVGGGSGATYKGPGVDAVHTHMTNTRLTDPEILETRYPCVLREFAIRHGSGGMGEKPGGCGIVREIEFTRPLTLSLLTGRKKSRPYGLDGGMAGQPGVNWLIDVDQSTQELPWRCEIPISQGQRLRLETPGGGGVGAGNSGCVE